MLKQILIVVIVLLNGFNLKAITILEKNYDSLDEIGQDGFWTDSFNGNEALFYSNQNGRTTWEVVYTFKSQTIPAIIDCEYYQLSTLGVIQNYAVCGLNKKLVDNKENLLTHSEVTQYPSISELFEFINQSENRVANVLIYRNSHMSIYTRYLLDESNSPDGTYKWVIKNKCYEQELKGEVYLIYEYPNLSIPTAFEIVKTDKGKIESKRYSLEKEYDLLQLSNKFKC